MQPLLTDILFLVGFCLFLILQALACNSMYECFRGACVKDIEKGEVCKGNIFYPLSRFLDKKIKNEWIKQPLFKCPKCMASCYGTITFWGTIFPVFGFHPFEIWVWIWDVIILVSLNWIIYKKL